MMKILAYVLFWGVFIFQWVLRADWVTELPSNCLARKKQPCVLEFKKKAKIQISLGQIWGDAGSQLVLMTPDQVKSIKGSFLFEIPTGLKWIFARHQVDLKGVVLIQSEQSQHQLYQLEDQSLYLGQGLLEGLELVIQGGRVEPPKNFNGQDIFKDLQKVKRIDIVQWQKWNQTWDQNKKVAAESFRQIASQFEIEREERRLEQLAETKRKEQEDRKYKEAFRMRYFSPEKWSEFLQDPNFSP